MFSFHRLILSAAVVCLAACPTLFAQQLSISGTVRDSGGVIPDAQVVLRDPVGGISKTTSDAVGEYKFGGLRTGSYELSVSRKGFSPATSTLTLASESRTVNVTLEVAGVATSIDVNDVVGRGTASGMEVPNNEIPSYVATVTERTLREQGTNDLSTALENVSGVMTQVQYGVYEWFTVSGITQQSGTDFMYVDGLTLTGNRSRTQLNDIQEVQVLKGPNSILYGGAGAGQGGIINVIRKKPSSARTNEIQYQAGRWGMQHVSGSATGPLLKSERLMYRLDGSYSHTDGWRQNGANRFAVGPKLTWLIGPRMWISTVQTIIRDRYTLDAGVPAALVGRPGGFPFDRKLNPPQDFQLTRDWQNEIDYVWNITNRLSINNTFFKRKNRDQYNDGETLTYVAATDQVNRGILYYQRNQRPLQDITDLTGDYKVFSMRHKFLARYDYSDQYDFRYRTGSAPGLSNSTLLPLTPVPIPAFIAGTFVDNAATYTNFPITRVDYVDNRFHRIVLQDQIYPVRWLAVNLVMSRPNFDRRARNDSYDNGNFVSQGVETHLVNQSKNNYRMGAVLLPQDNWFAWTRGFKPYFSYNTSFNPVFSVQADGTPLDPVINKSWEVGTSWQGIKQRLNITTAARKIQDQNRVITISPGVFEQVGKASTYNMDLDINGGLGRGFFLNANYSFADSLIDRLRTDGLPQTNGGKRFPNASKHISRIWITKQINVGQESQLTFSVGGRYVRHYFTNQANTTVVPSLTTFDGQVSWNRRKYDIQVNFANLLNKQRYFTSVINGSQLYPGPPFNATLTMRYRF